LHTYNTHGRRYTNRGRLIPNMLIQSHNGREVLRQPPNKKQARPGSVGHLYERFDVLVIGSTIGKGGISI
jgi:hypothetical protein